MRRITKGYWQSVIAALVVGLGLITPVTTPQAQSGGNPSVIPPNTKPHGLTYGEWSAKWWQWAYSLPVTQNPFFDETGCANGANGQSGPVWFLTGVINSSGTAVRNCTVPAGKMIFFPILNVECATLEGNGSTEAELRACTDSFMNFVTSVAADIDSVQVADIQRYRAPSPLFIYGPLPPNNVVQFFGFNAPAGSTSLSIADGFYLMLKPLSVGPHTIHYTGTFGPPINFTLDITYNLTVVGGQGNN